VTKALNCKTRREAYAQALDKAIEHPAEKLTIDFVRQWDAAMTQAVVAAG
jgi:hypothetical protein